jgi:hypothetical protein
VRTNVTVAFQFNAHEAVPSPKPGQRVPVALDSSSWMILPMPIASWGIWKGSSKGPNGISAPAPSMANA